MGIRLGFQWESPTVKDRTVDSQGSSSDFAIIIIDETRGHVLSLEIDRRRFGPRMFVGRFGSSKAVAVTVHGRSR